MGYSPNKLDSASRKRVNRVEL